MLDLYNAIDAMKRAAVDAGKLLVQMQPKIKRLEARKDFLTDADLKSEQAICQPPQSIEELLK